MQIELPEDAVVRAKRLATGDEDAADVFVKALDSLEWERSQVAAVLEGVADFESGRCRPYDEFAAEFRAERGIAP